MTYFATDEKNRIIFYDNLIGYIKDNTAVVDELFRTEELQRCLSKRSFSVRWEQGIFDLLAGGEVPAELPQNQTKCRIWQLKNDVPTEMRFIGYEETVRKFGEPKRENYTVVFNGILGTENLEKIFEICRDEPPTGYTGHRMGLADVVEIYGETESRCYFCDRIGFREIKFTEENR